MKRFKKITIAVLAVVLLPLLPLAAQEDALLFESYDPLIPQMFAFDKKNAIFAGINHVDNEIVIVRYRENQELYISHRILVDKVEGKHDIAHIYRPKSVAIYDGYIVFLASHVDSCYFAVLDLNGRLVNKLMFLGQANAFSYSPSARELYISGENPTGFDVIVLNTGNGIRNVKKEDALALHYQRYSMSEEIAKRDPWGIGMAVIAMSVVFLALLTLFLVFKQLGLRLVALQRHSRKAQETKIEVKSEAIYSNMAISEGVYAAIATAIHLYGEELHDVENTVLTINKVSRSYSPWSSKVHGLNTYFKR